MQRAGVIVVAVVLGSALIFWLLTLSGPTGSGSGPVVVIETSMGTMKVQLYENRAPITVRNFLAYVDEKHYDGTIFHRVIRDFMIQGGGFEPGLKPKGSKHRPIQNEAIKSGLLNEAGTLAMARTND